MTMSLIVRVESKGDRPLTDKEIYELELQLYILEEDLATYVGEYLTDLEFADDLVVEVDLL